MEKRDVSGRDLDGGERSRGARILFKDKSSSRGRDGTEEEEEEEPAGDLQRHLMQLLHVQDSSEPGSCRTRTPAVTVHEATKVLQNLKG